jgi:hypothetical protein
VPYDDHALPLLSPDGRFAATETGVGPRWETAVADPGCPGHDATRVEIYALDYETLVAPAPPPTLVAALPGPLLLGRGGDQRGFLVEQHNRDDSRWIGMADWRSGQIDWLVQDGATNAFATIGPLGQLAWSRRSSPGGHFDLVVRGGDGREWTIATGDDWLFPTWSGRSEGLFVFVLRAGRLALGHATARNVSSFQQSLKTMDLIQTGATVDDAYRAVVSQPLVVTGIEPREDELAFFHPALDRSALWRPHAMRIRDVNYFIDRSYTAVIDQTNFALVSTEDRLWRQNLLNERDRIHLLKGLFIPRATGHGDWPYVLLSPSRRDGRVALTAMALLPLPTR